MESLPLALGFAFRGGESGSDNLPGGGASFPGFRGGFGRSPPRFAARGALVMADSITPEDDAVADWMNDIELRRDFQNAMPAVIEAFQVGELEEDGDFLFSLFCNILLGSSF